MAQRKLIERDGAGTIHQHANDRFSAMCYSRKLGRSKHIGTFDTLDEAEQAIIDEQGSDRPSERGSRPSSAAREVGRAVSTYLKLIRDDALDGTGAVMLGALPGFPAATRDPEEVERAAKLFEARADETSAVLTQLNLRARVVKLRAAADALRKHQDSTAEDDFIAHAKEYATGNDVPYGAWRVMGVSADVLKRAGIEP